MEHPTDLLKTFLDNEVIVKFKESTSIQCRLHGFDEHFNLIVSEENKNTEYNAMLIRGEMVESISMNKF